MRLVDFPSGASLFIDANCLLYHFLDSHPSCTYTLHRSELGEIRTFTSLPVLAEVRHRLMVLEASSRFGLPPRKVLAYLKRHSDRIKLLRTAVEAVESLNLLRVEVLVPSTEIFLASQRIGEECGLLTIDALTVAIMRARHLVHLASNDNDFARVPGLTLWRP